MSVMLQLFAAFLVVAVPINLFVVAVDDVAHDRARVNR